MDKGWMDMNRRLPQYEAGVDQFLEFAFKDYCAEKLLRCPCRICRNNHFTDRNSMRNHLMMDGVKKDYRIWDRHGESHPQSENAHDVDMEEHSAGLHEMATDFLNAATATATFQNTDGAAASDTEQERISETTTNEEANKFHKVMEDAEQELYPGCNAFSTLSFIVQMLNFKCLYDVSGNAMSALFDMLYKAFPSKNKVPKSFDDAKKIMSELGFDYSKIHACPNDCILYRGAYAEAESCHVCGLSRWKEEEEKNGRKSRRRRARKIPQKVLRYFPLIPRLKRIYMCSKIASDMQWHKKKGEKEGHMSHPADSTEWKNFDKNFPNFASDARNVRIGLASDGFNPYGNMSSKYSIWPVVLILYNLPPWMCMKDPYIIMSMIIPGPKAPGNDIDVYLEPLVDELMQLWEGVQAYDAATKSTFKLHAALLWTINDFPAYGNLSGMSTKGQHACPCCHTDTWSHRLINGHKYCYMGHRRFLPAGHAWRNNATSFDGRRERRCAPKPLSGDDIIEQYANFDQVTSLI